MYYSWQLWILHQILCSACDHEGLLSANAHLDLYIFIFESVFKNAASTLIKKEKQFMVLYLITINHKFQILSTVFMVSFDCSSCKALVFLNWEFSFDGKFRHRGPLIILPKNFSEKVYCRTEKLFCNTKNAWLRWHVLIFPKIEQLNHINLKRLHYGWENNAIF